MKFFIGSMFTVGAVWASFIMYNGHRDPLSAMIVPCALIGLSIGLWANESIS